MVSLSDTLILGKNEQSYISKSPSRMWWRAGSVSFIIPKTLHDMEQYRLIEEEEDTTPFKANIISWFLRHWVSFFWFCIGVLWAIFVVSAIALDRTRNFTLEHQIYSTYE